MTEFGNLALVEEREEREGGAVAVKLPGVKRGDMCSRTTKPEVIIRINNYLSSYIFFNLIFL